MNKRTSRIQTLMACIGDPSRFRIVQVLAAKERYVLELADLIGLSQSCTTRHLQVLVRVGLVTRARRGKRVMFRLRREEPAIGGLVEWVLGRAFSSTAKSRPAKTGEKPAEKPVRAPASEPGVGRKEESGSEPAETPSSESRILVQEDEVDEQKPYEELEDFLL